ncbi:hypothetical protein KGP36_04100 [Patescibacteria group bacterium]|nr:hypothetical protein [Patescibacteria group bacterium]
MADERTEKILADARKRLANAIAAYATSRPRQLDDLKFAAADPDNHYQWPPDVLQNRTVLQGETINARPCLTVNKLPQHIRQVTNDQRENNPAGEVIPVGEGADIEVAEILEGMVRHIQYTSEADIAYDTACENQVTHGEGFFRLLTEFESPDSFDQVIKVGRIRNSFSVYMDPLIQHPCGADADWCFITEEISKDEYERKFPDAKPVSSLENLGIGDENLTQWVKEKTVRIAEYFYVEHRSATLNLYPGNQTAFDGTPKDQKFRREFGKPTKTRQSEKRVVKWLKTNGFDILEETDWLGQWIPVIRVVGSEWEIEGQLYVSGIVRAAKDAQRMYNYMASSEVEFLALAPKAPFVGYAGQFENFEARWKTANIKNWPYLEANAVVDDVSGQVLPLPQRSPPPMPQVAIVQAKQGAADDIKSTTGQYNASLGMTSNERSGTAIMARQREGDVGTFHFVDNHSRAIRFATRQIIDLIPKVYDTFRIARIIREGGEHREVKINPMQEQAVSEVQGVNGNVIEKIYNPGVGTYDVCVVTGPGYATKRQQALDQMENILKANPQLWAVAGDLLVKNMDWPGAQELASRLQKAIPPNLLGDPSKDPALQAAQQQIQQLGQQLQQMHGMLQNVQNTMEAKETQIKEFGAQIKAYDAETRRIAAIAAGMTPDEVQSIVLQTLQAALRTGGVQGAPSMLPTQEVNQ